MRAEDVFRERQREDAGFARAWAEEQPSSNLSLNIYRYRKMMGLSQAELGKRAGMSQPKIAKLEAADGNPSLRTIGRLSHALGVSPGALLADPYTEVIADRESAARAIFDSVLAKSQSYLADDSPELVTAVDWGVAPRWDKRTTRTAALGNELLMLAVE